MRHQEVSAQTYPGPDETWAAYVRNQLFMLFTLFRLLARLTLEWNRRLGATEDESHRPPENGQRG